MTVCILGSINRDVVCRVTALPRPGETVAARETMLLPGGKGANQAVAAARMGAVTRMIGAVGADADGDALTRQLAQEGIDIAGVARLSDTATGAAYISVDDGGENQIVVAPGANARIDVAAAAATIGPEDRVILTQFEVPVATIAAVFAAAGAQGSRRIVNAAPALVAGAGIFAQADILIFNQSELAVFLGLSTPPASAEDAVAARRLLTHAGQAVIVTLGAAGAVLVEAERLTMVPGAARCRWSIRRAQAIVSAACSRRCWQRRWR